MTQECLHGCQDQKQVFIEIKYSVSYGLVMFITNYPWFRILKISKYRSNNGSVLKYTSFVHKFNFVIYERIVL